MLEDDGAGTPSQGEVQATTRQAFESISSSLEPKPQQQQGLSATPILGLGTNPEIGPMMGSGKEPLQGSLFKVGFKVGCRASVK